METASSGLALAESSTPLTWGTVARTGAQYVGNLTNQCHAKFTSPHPKCYLLALYQIEEKTLYPVSHVNIWVQCLQLWQGSPQSWNFRLECKSPFEDHRIFFFLAEMTVILTSWWSSLGCRRKRSNLIRDQMTSETNDKTSVGGHPMTSPNHKLQGVIAYFQGSPNQ